MFIDTDEIRKLRQKYYLQMQKSGIKTFQDMDRIKIEALESGELSQKYKELIALGISITSIMCLDADGLKIAPAGQAERYIYKEIYESKH